MEFFLTKEVVIYCRL